MDTKETIIENICSLMILKIASINVVGTSFMFRNIFLNMLGIIEDESFLIKKMEEEELLLHAGLFENSNFYKFISTTEKGIKYFNEKIKSLEIPKEEFSKERQILLRKYLGLDN